MFNLKLNEPKILNNSIGVISDFITEASFSIQKEGIKLIAMDPANISMVILTILPSAFTEYSVDDQSDITINLDAFKQALKRAKPSDNILMNLEKNKLKITISGRSTKRFYIPLLIVGTVSGPLSYIFALFSPNPDFNNSIICCFISPFSILFLLFFIIELGKYPATQGLDSNNSTPSDT